MNDKLVKLLKTVDHTQLSVAAREVDYIVLCNEAKEYNVASVCVPPSRVKLCADKLKGAVAVCTVVGFPNGYSSSKVKAFEAKTAIEDGATEIDMVIDVGLVKDGNFDAVLADIKEVRATTQGYILKVIIETSMLTQDEKLELCKVVSQSGADYIKTSTGFGGGGATFDDVKLLRENVAPNVKVKAAGGISTLDDGENFINIGAERLGTSRIIKLIKGMTTDGY